MPDKTEEGEAIIVIADQDDHRFSDRFSHRIVALNATGVVEEGERASYTGIARLSRGGTEYFAVTAYYEGYFPIERALAFHAVNRGETAGVQAAGRKPTADDFKAWMSAVFDRSDEIHGSEDIHWNDMALGFLVARGVDSGFTDWELLSSYTCGDEERMREALVSIDAMNEPTRPEVDDDDLEDDDGEDDEEMPL